MEMQALQLAYASILLCLFRGTENSLAWQKAYPDVRALWNFFTLKQFPNFKEDAWLKMIKH